MKAGSIHGRDFLRVTVSANDKRGYRESLANGGVPKAVLILQALRGTVGEDFAVAAAM